ncbi:hypothetical protein FQN54_007629 [Arachnomyces sp. PD_36]|nr:hypothetical protein FQN54_007629 [Arachnomyces sp. PD_36]
MSRPNSHPFPSPPPSPPLSLSRARALKAPPTTHTTLLTAHSTHTYTYTTTPPPLSDPTLTYNRHITLLSPSPPNPSLSTQALEAQQSTIIPQHDHDGSGGGGGGGGNILFDAYIIHSTLSKLRRLEATEGGKECDKIQLRKLVGRYKRTFCALYGIRYEDISTELETTVDEEGVRVRVRRSRMPGFIIRVYNMYAYLLAQLTWMWESMSSPANKEAMALLGQLVLDVLEEWWLFGDEWEMGGA